MMLGLTHEQEEEEERDDDDEGGGWKDKRKKRWSNRYKNDRKCIIIDWQLMEAKVQFIGMENNFIMESESELLMR